MKKLFLLLFTIFCITVKAEYLDKSFSNKLKFTADKKDNLSLFLFKISKHCQEHLSENFFKLPIEAKDIHIKLEGTPPPTTSFRTIYFKRKDLQNLNTFEILSHINKNLIKRTLSALGSKNLTIPAWFIATINYQIQMGDSSFLTQEKYPITRYSIINKQYADLDFILELKEPAPSSYWLYRVYAEQCTVFVQGLIKSKGGKRALIDFLTKSKKAFIGDYFPQLSSSAARNNWYREACKKTCFNIINPYPFEVIQEKVERMFSITIARPGGSKRTPLEDISEKDHKVIDKAYINFLQKDFFSLLLSSSLTLRPGLTHFLKAFERLQKGEINEFKEAVRTAKTEFIKVLDKQKSYTLFLDQLEKKHNNSLGDYHLIIQIEEMSKKRRQVTFSQWQLYLDQLEQKLEDTALE